MNTKMIFEIFAWGLAGFLLIPGSCQDVRRQSVSGNLLKISGTLTFCLCLIRIVKNVYKEADSAAAWANALADPAFGLIPGICLLIVSFFRKDSIGKGDGIAVLILGLLLGAERVCLLVFLSLFSASLWSIILLGRKKAAFDTRIPFFPFLAFGTVLVLIMGLSGGLEG